jgi:23S rRNA-/tRNA-specific pseudouridylate synthase
MIRQRVALTSELRVRVYRVSAVVAAAILAAVEGGILPPRSRLRYRTRRTRACGESAGQDARLYGRRDACRHGKHEPLRSMEKLFEIIHEDAEVLAINKPAGLVCHPTKADSYSSLISRVRRYVGQASRLSGSTGFQPVAAGTMDTPAGKMPGLPGSQPHPAGKMPAPLHRQDACATRPHLINRLDRETSGVVLVAKNAAAARELRRIWETRTVRKEYVTIVHGHVNADRDVIDAPLGRDERSRVAIKDCVRPDGAPSQTEFWVLRRFTRAEGDFTLLRVVPYSGRKHQIRIHLAYRGHPIVGDKIYGHDEALYLDFVNSRLTTEQRRRLILPCHALHASRVQLEWRDGNWNFAAQPESWFTDFAGASLL